MSDHPVYLSAEQLEDPNEGSPSTAMSKKRKVNKTGASLRVLLCITLRGGNDNKRRKSHGQHVDMLYGL